MEFLRTEGEELRRRESMFMESCQRDCEMRIQSAMASLSHLPQEIDSLKSVIELKNSELHELRHQNMDLQRQVSKRDCHRQCLLEENLEKNSPAFPAQFVSIRL